MGKSGLLIRRQEKENGEKKGAGGESLLHSENIFKEDQLNQYSLISKQTKDQ